MDLQSPHLRSAALRKTPGGRLVLSRPGREKSAVPEQHPVEAFRVLISDRDSMSSDLLAAVLRRDRSCHAAAVPPSDLFRRLTTSRVDLVVISADQDHTSLSGFDLARQVSSEHRTVLIVMLLNQSSPASVLDAFRSGARGVFSRRQPIAEFFDCVERVRKGFIWAAEQETTFLLEAFRSIPSPAVPVGNHAPPLTMRELQVVRCAAKGKTNKVIASELGLSEHTVKNYLFRTFEKLGVSNRVELLLYLIVRGYALGSDGADSPEASSCEDGVSSFPPRAPARLPDPAA